LIRSFAIVLLMLAAVVASLPSSPQTSTYVHSFSTSNAVMPIDPTNGTLAAFNYTYSQAALYSGNSTNPLITRPSNTANTTDTSLSTVTRTSDKSLIPYSGFRFNITGPRMIAAQESLNWTLLAGNFTCSGCSSVSVNFDIFGNITRGTSANYTLTLARPNATVLIARNSFNTLGQFRPNATATCPESVCINVPSKYLGYSLVLSFVFSWNGTSASPNQRGMFAQLSEITVSSTGTPNQAKSNFMQPDPSNSTRVIHTADLRPIAYNLTALTHLHPGTANTTRPWQIALLNIYYPAGYKLQQIQMNGTLSVQLNNTVTSPARAPFENLPCAPGTGCAASILSLNMSDFFPVSRNSNMTIFSRTINTITQLATTAGGIATQFFTSGDMIGVRVVNQPSIVNASVAFQTGTLIITFSPQLSIPTSSVSTVTGAIYNFTLPPDCGSTGALCENPWTVTTAFSSGFDMGSASASFRINLLQVSLTGTGGSNSLSVQGALTYGNGTAAPGVNATLFAIDTGTHVNIPVTNLQTSHSPSLLYISNVTLVNGVFTQGQSLIILFTIVNPNAAQQYNATVTIAHEWPGPQTHNMSTTFSINPGDHLNDLPFNSTRPETYEATIMFAGNGVQVTLENLRTEIAFPTRTMTSGTSPVLPNAPQAGLFNVTVTSLIGNIAQGPANSLTSKTYAYVTSLPVPSRYFYGSPVFKTGAGGSFSQTISSAQSLVGAENLTVFVLARDGFGVVVMNNLPSSTYFESTALIPTTDSIGPVAEGSSATATLHLTSNSTVSKGITAVITVNLIIQASGLAPQTVATATNVMIGPGQSVAVPLSFTAPSSVGSYTLTFSSPEYGGVLTSQTLQVTILPGYVQFLIPAGIGVVIAIIVLGVYLIRGRKEEQEIVSEKPKGSSEKTKSVPGAKPPSKSLTRPMNVRL